MEIMGYQDMLMINVVGCAEYPDGYPFGGAGVPQCTTSKGMGWIAVAYFVIGKVVGTLVLTSLVIGFVIQAFAEVYDIIKNEWKEDKKIVR